MPFLTFAAALCVFLGGIVAAASYFKHMRFLEAFFRLKKPPHKHSRAFAKLLSGQNGAALAQARPSQSRTMKSAIIVILVGNGIFVCIAAAGFLKGF